jgi:hypothetical protein
LSETNSDIRFMLFDFQSFLGTSVEFVAELAELLVHEEIKTPLKDPL